MKTPWERIQLIEGSLRCFDFGLLSLVPLLGIPFALKAIGLHLHMWTESGREWNPARYHLWAGCALAWLGALLAVGEAGLVLWMVQELRG